MSHSVGTPGQDPGARTRGAWPFAPVNSEPPTSPVPPPNSPIPPTPSGPIPPTPSGPIPPTPSGASWTPSGRPATPAAPPPTRRSVTQVGAPPTPPVGGYGVTDEPRRRRPPLWLLIVLGVAVLGAIAAVVFLMRPGPPEVLEPEVITLPTPTPTIEPIERAAGTAFFESLPSEVLAFALADYGEWEGALIAGGLEGYYLVYGDGSATVTLYAGQWRDAESAEAAFDQAVAAAAAAPAVEPTEEPAAEPTGEATAGPTEGAETAAPAPEPEEGIVEVDGQQVGRYLLLPRSDGTASLWWTNQTVLLQLEGPLEELRDLFTAFPL